MKTIVTLVLLLLAIAPTTWGSVVIHDGREGIVASSYDQVWQSVVYLDSNGCVWAFVGGPPPYLQRHVAIDPPVPVAEIKAWEGRGLVTIDNMVWSLQSGTWASVPWPSSSLPWVGSMASSAPNIAPNPATDRCEVRFSLPSAGQVSITVFDAAGRRVRHVLDGHLPAGSYSPVWDGRDDAGLELPSGVYFAKITTPAGEQTAKLVLAR